MTVFCSVACAAYENCTGRTHTTSVHETANASSMFSKCWTANYPDTRDSVCSRDFSACFAIAFGTCSYVHVPCHVFYASSGKPFRLWRNSQTPPNLYLLAGAPSQRNACVHTRSLKPRAHTPNLFRELPSFGGAACTAPPRSRWPLPPFLPAAALRVSSSASRRRARWKASTSLRSARARGRARLMGKQQRRGRELFRVRSSIEYQGSTPRTARRTRARG